MPFPPEVEKKLQSIVGADNFHISPEKLAAYAYDAAWKRSLPEAVLFPGDEDQVSRVMALADQLRIPVTPRGAGTGMTGGSVPVSGGIVMAMTRLNRILSINEGNCVAEVEPGVVTADFQKAVEEKGLFYPPDPSSAPYCTMGGNAAECAGGPRAVAYGVTRDYVLGLSAVLASGKRIKTGVKTAKGVVGYDLTRLLVGSEGTLAVITGITVRLLPLPGAVRTLTAVFRDIRDAAAAVSAIFAAGIVARSIEYMDRAAIACAEDYMHAGLPADAGAVLLLEVDGEADCVDGKAERLAAVCTARGAYQVLPAGAGQAAALWKARKALSPALFRLGPDKINEDIVVPRDRIPDMVARVDEIRLRTGLAMVTFGHAGDGNMHVNVMLDRANPAQAELAEKAVSEIFDYTLALGGTLSGEHGVGLTKMPYIGREIDPLTMSLMREIKKVFDPHNILNPGKMFPS
ncbi:MAG: FAD-linked oxidase C-terminal domain-containing protein [Thermodesulfobacteriota bacterium]